MPSSPSPAQEEASDLAPAVIVHPPQDADSSHTQGFPPPSLPYGASLGRDLDNDQEATTPITKRGRSQMATDGLTRTDIVASLNDDVEALRDLLQTERAICRQWRDQAIKAQDALQNNHVNLGSLASSNDHHHHHHCQRGEGLGSLGISSAMGANYSIDVDVMRMVGSSIIHEIGVETHFKYLSHLLGKSKRSISSTTVVLKNVTHKYKVGEAGQAFPTVGEALVQPFLTWCKRISSSSSKEGKDGRPVRRNEIRALKNISTVLEPDKLYLVVGGPKSGKTSLLKAIAGRQPQSFIVNSASSSGEITYNGHKASDRKFDVASLACYVEETDNHEPLLTVRETLLFAGQCIIPVPTRKAVDSVYFRALVEKLDLDPTLKKQLLAYENVTHPKIRLALAKQRCDIILTLLGLTGCADTIVGDTAHRGVSGGEKRRVTLAEVLMGDYSVCCFDEISNGLDAAATHDIIRMIRASVHSFNYTCIISLNQPSPEVYGLFDEVILLREGQIVYQGPPMEAKQHFESIGFKCPTHCDVADFLIQVTGPNPYKLHRSQDELMEDGGDSTNGDPSVASAAAALSSPPTSSSSIPSTTTVSTAVPQRPPRHTNEYVQHYHRSMHGTVRMASTESGGSHANSHHTFKWNELRAYYNTWWTALIIVFQREVTLTLRDWSYLVARLLQDTLLGLLTGFMFWQIPALGGGAVQTRFGAMYQVLLTIAFQTAACIPTYFLRRRVFYKQNTAGFFSCSTYLLATTAAAAPLVLIDGVIFGVITYWCMGFAKDQSGLRFALFLSHLIVVGWAMMAFFRLTTYLCPNLTMAAAASGMVTFFLLLFSGFIIAVQQIPDWYVWILWANPLYFGFQGISCNEFLSQRYSAVVGENGKSVGQYILEQKGLSTDETWRWWGLIANAAVTAFYLLVTLVAMRYVEWEEPVSGGGGLSSSSSAPSTSSTSFKQHSSNPQQQHSSLSSSHSSSINGHGNGASNNHHSPHRLIRHLSSVLLGKVPEAFGLITTSSDMRGDGPSEPPARLPIKGGVFSNISGLTMRSSVPSTIREDPEEEAKDEVLLQQKRQSTKTVDMGLSSHSHTWAMINNGQGYHHDEVEGKDERASAHEKLALMYRSFSHLPFMSTISFVPVSLTFENVWYTVSIKSNETIDLLQGVSGYVTPGSMTALMGSSGAGKSTLLDVLAGRKTGGTIKGAILVNGQSLESSVFKSISGYVEQVDIHSPFMTVKEVLHFSADLRLCQKMISPQQRHQFVHDILNLLELERIQDSVIGPPGAGLSTEELKRVTIGTEIVANPSILFLDEPTSGLDARAANIVIRVCRKLAQSGRSIICTIHQPSTELFGHFDTLLLLKRGGQTVFAGPVGVKASTLIDYLESIPGTPKFQTGDNPATWMLECIGAGTRGIERCDYASEFKTSSLFVRNLEMVHRLTQPQSHDDETYEMMHTLHSHERANCIKQLVTCVKRAWRCYWRIPEYQLGRIGGVAAMGLVLGTIYFSQNQDTVPGLVSFVALIFLTVTFLAAINSTAVLQVIHLEKAAFCRERFANMYLVPVYTLSWFIVEIPWILAETVVLMLTFYLPCHYSLEGWRVMWFAAFTFLYMLFATSFGQAIGALCPSTQVGQIIISTIAPIFSMLSGMTIMPQNVPSGWIPLWILTPFNKAFEGLVTTQWEGDTQGALPYFHPKTFLVENVNKSVFLREFFGEKFTMDDRYRDVGALIGFVLVFQLGYMLAFKYKKMENR